MTPLNAPLPLPPRPCPARPAVVAYLHPGQVLAYGDAAEITTVLGSCVSICLFHPRLGVGGMNHFVLPHSGGANAGSARFAGPAFEQLLARLRLLGARPDGLYAKLFGGAGTMGTATGELAIGLRNVEAARALLSACGIPLVAEDVGGEQGRKVRFETFGGAAWVRSLGGGQS